MTTDRARKSSTRAWLRIASRELRGGLGGFWIYLACLALGAWAIAAAGSITTSFTHGLDQQARMLLGGDGQLVVSQREASDAELSWMADRATAVSQTVSTDMMARGETGVRQIDVRAVDDAFPLLGEVGLDPGARDLADALAQRDGVWGVAVTQSLLDAVGAEIGDRIDLGGGAVEIRARLDSEPDRLGDPGAFQPRALIALEALREMGQLAPGRLYRAGYRVLLKPEHVEGFEEAAEEAWGEEGMRARAPEDAIDGLRDLLGMLNSFMSVVGIAALVAGGVGVAQATSSFLDSRIDSIAALKALGADAGMIRAAYATQLGVLAIAGAVGGVLLGALSPWLLDLAAGGRIPLPAELGVYPLALGKALVLALLAAVMFASPALGRARATPPAALFRREGGATQGRTPWLERTVAVCAGVALALTAALSSTLPWVTLGLLAGAGGAFLILSGVALLIRRVARWGGRRARGYLRLALSNLGGPGSLASVVAPALGLGLALMSFIAVVQLNLLGQLRDTAPANAPSVIFRQVPHDEIAAFDVLMREQGVDLDDAEAYRRAPFILGRVTALKGEPLDDSKVAPEERWVTRGETGMTFLGQQPPEANIQSGAWWPADYTGPLLVSVEEGAARGLRLRVGDTIGFRIYGRDVEAEVASTRRVDWGGFGTNMAFILSPGTLEAARPFHTAIVIVPPEKEDALVKAVADRWPEVLAFQLRRTLETAADLFEEIALVVTLLASVVTTAGVLVLFGAFAATARKRRRESALLKVFGATRSAILALYAGEFALAGLAAAVMGALMGVAAAHPIVIGVFEAQWRFEWGPVLTVGLFAVLAASAGGAAVGWATLSHRPGRVLRSA